MFLGCKVRRRGGIYKLAEYSTVPYELFIHSIFVQVQQMAESEPNVWFGVRAGHFFVEPDRNSNRKQRCGLCNLRLFNALVLDL
jgi:hypothetical protein